MVYLSKDIISESINFKREGIAMSINEEGFLSKEIKEYQGQIISKYQSLFALGKEVNQFAHKVKCELRIHNEQQMMIVACALIKLNNNLQSIYILCSYGLIVDAKIILRSMFEVLFILKVSCEDDEFVKKYVGADQIYRKRLLEAGKNNSVGVFDETIRNTAEKVLNKIEQDIRANNIEELKIEQLAKKAKMKAFYDTAYRALCNTAHSGARSLQEYFLFDKNNKLSALNFGPIDVGIDLVMITAINNMCIGLVSILNFFKIDKAETLKSFQRRIDLENKKQQRK